MGHIGNSQSNVVTLPRLGRSAIRYKQRCDDAARLVISALGKVDNPYALTLLIAALDTLTGGPQPNHLAMCHKEMK